MKPLLVLLLAIPSPCRLISGWSQPDIQNVYLHSEWLQSIIYTAQPHQLSDHYIIIHHIIASIWYYDQHHQSRDHDHHHPHEDDDHQLLLGLVQLNLQLLRLLHQVSNLFFSFVSAYLVKVMMIMMMIRVGMRRWNAKYQKSILQLCLPLPPWQLAHIGQLCPSRCPSQSSSPASSSLSHP